MEETSGGMCPQFNRAQSVCFLKIELWSEITHMFQLFLLCCMRPEGPWQRLLRMYSYLYLSTRVGYFFSLPGIPKLLSPSCIPLQGPVVPCR